MGLFSNYCGPGGRGIPRHVTDTLCKLHDESEEYKHILWAYSHFNGADEDFLKALGDVIPQSTEERLVKWGAETYFNLKKKFFPSGMVGRSPSMRWAGKRRSTTTNEELVEAGLAPDAKMRALMPPSYDADYADYDWDDSDNDSMPSFENSPGGETMAMTTRGGDDAPLGIEGAETQIDKPHDVWTRFPNHQFAKLGWWYTNFITDVAGSVAQQGKDAFDNPDVETTTDLFTTGGGVRNPTTGASTLGVTGWAGYTPSGHDFKNPMMFQLRMTTPYNILKTYAGQGLVGNATGHSQPNWLEMFEGKYQFYHVNECDWRVDFNFGTPWIAGSPAVNFPNAWDMGYYIFWKYTSNDVPPLTFPMSNNQISYTGAVDAEGNRVTGVNPMTGGSFTQKCTPDDYFRMKGFHSKHVSLNAIGPTHVTIAGKYKFGQCKMDIKQQDHSTLGGTALQTEGWIQTGSTYLFPEDLTIIIVADNAMNSVGGIFTPVGYRMNTEMLTEFRDLRSAFKFPTPANSFINTANTVNTESVFFNKGAAYT